MQSAGGSGLGFTLNSGSLVFTYPCTGADITESVAVPNNEWVFAAATYSATTSGPTGESGANVEVLCSRSMLIMYALSYNIFNWFYGN